MDAMDTEMDADPAAEYPMEAAPLLSSQPPLLPPRDDGDGAWDLLALARQLVQQGKPSVALRAVLMAMKSKGGEQAVIQTLNRAKELYRNKIQANTAADELASLFAECVIAEAQPLESNLSLQGIPNPSRNPADQVMLPDADDTSILALSGRKQIVLDAFADGSSFICLQCGGLVSSHRKDEHLAYWCG